MRKLGFPLQVHKDHISAVISLDYSPTGQEFVSAGYDKTIRIFPTFSRRSREVYHTKRMQRLTDILWSADSKYLISSSDEMDIRIWKANASEKLGFVSIPAIVIDLNHQNNRFPSPLEITTRASQLSVPGKVEDQIQPAPGDSSHRPEALRAEAHQERAERARHHRRLAKAKVCRRRILCFISLFANTLYFISFAGRRTECCTARRTPCTSDSSR